MAKALKMASVGPVMVTIRSGQFPSEMLILAPLWKEKRSPGIATAKQSGRVLSQPDTCASLTAFHLTFQTPTLPLQ